MNRIFSYIILLFVLPSGMALSTPQPERVSAYYEFYDCAPACDETFYDCNDVIDEQFHDCDDVQELLIEAVITSKNQKEIKRLILGGARINFPDEFGFTPLMYSAMYGKIENGIALLQLGANPVITDLRGYSALGIAEKYHGKLFSKIFAAAINRYTKKQ